MSCLPSKLLYNEYNNCNCTHDNECNDHKKISSVFNIYSCCISPCCVYLHSYCVTNTITVNVDTITNEMTTITIKCVRCIRDTITMKVGKI